MLKTGVFRWHTFRLMLITSLIWVIFGVCVLVYYMDCLDGNNIRCKRATILTSYKVITSINQDISNSNNDYFNSHHIHNQMIFHQKEDQIILPHYSSKELKSWKPVGLC
jgi:hypothetical protein